MPSNSASSQAISKTQPQTATEIREAEYKSFLEASLTTHGGYLSKPILALSTSLTLSIQNIAESLALVVLILHLLTPTYLLPHLSALITLVIPVQNTLHSLALDQQRDPDGARHSSQWLAYWKPGNPSQELQAAAKRDAAKAAGQAKQGEKSGKAGKGEKDKEKNKESKKPKSG
ncbi:MAG: hypothetical protein TREMPRED_001413 [Tremellales sp. Tagirdzhanova-0007]|nr:MAG: hypothetical protein TREMPRED_001413 [Tremellales sp. Tagirdzhanova-0007]